MLLFLAFKFKRPLIGFLAMVLLVVQLTVITEQPPLLYVIASGIAHPLMAWILYLYMRDTKK